MDDRGRSDRAADDGHLPAAPRPAPPPSTVRLGPAGRGPTMVAAAIAVFLAVAIVKPWPAGVAPPDVPSRPTPTPSPTVDPLAGLRSHCQDPEGWRLYSHEVWGGRRIRSWRSLEPATVATGPLDPAIPTVPFGVTIEGLGYCSPWRPAERPPDGATVTAWRIGGSGSRTVAEALALEPLDPGWPTLLGNLYRPPRGLAGDPGTAGSWAAGTYVFAIRHGTYERWWAAVIDPVGTPRPPESPAPAARDGTTP